MPFCVHPLRVLPDRLAGRAADGYPGDDAVAGDPASQVVCQVLPLRREVVGGVRFLSDNAHLLMCGVAVAGAPGPCSRAARVAVQCGTLFCYHQGKPW